MPEPSHPWIDVAEAPLYTVEAPPRVVDEELATFLTVMDEWYGTLDHPIAFIVDLTQTQSVTFRQQAMMSEAEKRTKFKDFKYNRGQAFVVSSALVRGIVNVVWTVAVPTYPHAVFRTRNEARAWALARLPEARERSQSTATLSMPPR